MNSLLTVPAPSLPPVGETNLRQEHGVTRVVLMPLNAGSMHAYWEVSPLTWAMLEERWGKGVRTATHPLLRLHALGKAKDWTTEIKLPQGARHWYVQNPWRGGSWFAELGFMKDSKILMVASSNQISLPNGRVADKADDLAKWGPLAPSTPAAAAMPSAPDLTNNLAEQWKSINKFSSWVHPPS